jgi:hypothetical protein
MRGYTSTTLPAFDYLGPLSTLMTDGWSMRCDVLDDVMDVMRRSAPPSVSGSFGGPITP